MKERNTEIDNARGILILLVIMGHLLIYANPAYSNIAVLSCGKLYQLFPHAGLFSAFRDAVSQ